VRGKSRYNPNVYWRNYLVAAHVHAYHVDGQLLRGAGSLATWVRWVASASTLGFNLLKY